METTKSTITKQNAHNPQYMDMHYEKWYLVPWPDCQIFDEMEGADEGTVPVYVDEVPATFVSQDWLFNENEYE